jgi:glucose/arabinose dehydrogenase
MTWIGASPANAAGLPMTLVKDGFTEPVFLTNAGSGDPRLFVVELDGVIKIIEPDLSVKTFLDVSALILHDRERGLFSVAFHPNFATNGLFYIDYTRIADGATTIAEYGVSGADPDVADPASARIVLVVDQPYAAHNGGWMGFKGPNLFITVGDGGSPGDSLGYGQNKKVLNGKIVRINPLDPDGTGSRTYSIPATNPFVNRKGRDEIWSLGLRNTWRCSFDRGTGKLWCGDVGENSYEEIDRVRTGRGVNFGWSKVEALYNFVPGAAPTETLCTAECKTLPIASYSHAYNGTTRSAVTGGYVSRRSGATMYGEYVFGDYVSGKIWVIPASFKGGQALPDPVADTELAISSFGEGADGRIYLVDLGGAIYLLDGS